MRLQDVGFQTGKWMFLYISSSIHQGFNIVRQPSTSKYIFFPGDFDYLRGKKLLLEPS